MAYKIILEPWSWRGRPGAVYKERKEKDDNLKLTLLWEKSWSIREWM